MDDVLEALASGALTVEEARLALAKRGLVDVDHMGHLDAHREARTGIPEIVLAEGKTPEQVRVLVENLLQVRSQVIVSRLGPEALAASALADLDEATTVYDTQAQVALVRRPDHKAASPVGMVGIITGGTSDLPVATEARLVAEALGVAVHVEVDCGVAAPARVAPALERILDAAPDVVIVAAGREGTLATLVSALIPVPVIGLPVSTGYGAGGHGQAALHAMLQSCSPLAVVNIDAGVIAGALAARIARRAHTAHPPTG